MVRPQRGRGALEREEGWAGQRMEKTSEGKEEGEACLEYLVWTGVVALSGSPRAGGVGHLSQTGCRPPPDL